MTVENETKTSKEPMMSLEDIRLLLGVARRTLQTWRASGRLPEPDFIVGKTLRWWPQTIHNWINSGGPRITEQN